MTRLPQRYATRRVVTATTDLARRLGCRVTDPHVLSDGSNVLIHLRPAPIVARVATTSALIRPGVAAWLAREIDLARYLHAHRMPVAMPACDPPAGPHHHAGLDISFWQYIPHEPERTPSAAELAPALAELHEVLRGYPGELPTDGPLGDITRLVDLVDRQQLLTGTELSTLRAETETLRDALAGFPVQPLHGDAHQGNALATPNGVVWIDFEDTWRGPIGWDLASLADQGGTNFAVSAWQAYPDRPSDDELTTCIHLRQLFGLCWRLLMLHRYPHGEANARAHLDAWLDTAHARR
ncbi:phosphotransferase family protein [Nocardia sp. GCM10030253]|uniref:phosphotransferase family protein n=1 Tax=Nocardia sp. GCM10030253 TaxID=3273404 RepID=UPI00363BCF3A